MAVNDATLSLIKSFEGFVDHWYPDPASHGEPYTCCYGHTSGVGDPRYPATKAKKFTEAEGSAILAHDLNGAEKVVLDHVVKVLTRNQYGALVSFVYNVGGHAFTESTLLKKVNAGDFVGASKEFGKWTHAAGKVMPGLVKRRAAEAKLFMTPENGA